MLRKTKLLVFFFILACLVFTSVKASSGDNPSSPTTVAADTDLDIPYQKFVLKNGLTLLVHEDRKAPIVAVNVWYHVGSKNEKIGKTGFAHLFEHLMFNGSENYNKDYFQALERIGATDLNGTTNNDRTNYFQNVPKSALDMVLWLESDRMGHLLGAIDQAKLDEQRGVVQNEKRQGENQPYAVAFELITKATYPAQHPYSWTVIGSMEDLNAASLPDVQEWFKTYYGAANAVLVVAGDVNANEVKEKVEKYFGDIPAGPPIARHQVAIAKMTGERRQTVQDRVPQAAMFKVWNIPQWGSAEADYLDLASDVLGAGKNSRLFKRLVYDLQIASEASASIDINEIGGQFYVQVFARPGEDLNKIETIVNEEVTRFLAEGPTEAELKRIKAQYAARFIRGAERIGGFGGKSDILAMNQIYAGNPDYYKTTLKRVKDATAKDLQETAKKWLSDGSYTLTVTPFPEFTNEAKGVDRSKLPDLGPAPEITFPDLQRATLSNGLKVILAERHSAPLISLNLVVDAGYAADPNPGTANMAMSMLTEGTKNRDSLKISEDLANLGTNLGAFSDLDTSRVSLGSLKSTLDQSLDIFADVVLNPSFPDKEFKRLQKQQLDGIEQEKADPTSIALRLMPGLIYGKGHPYSQPFTGSGTPQSITNMTQADVVKYHQTWFKPNNSTLVVVGDTTLSEIVPKLEKLFKDWKSGEVPKKNIAQVNHQNKPIVYLVDRPGSLQSIIVAGHIAPQRSNADELAVNTMNNVLGGVFTSRLNLNLREDKHWSYGVFSFLADTAAQRPFLSISPVQTDKTKESISEVVKELREVLDKRPITQEEFLKDQTNQVLGLPGGWETNGRVLNSILDIVRYGYPDTYYKTYANQVRDLKLDQVNAAARKVIQPNKLIWLIVGDRSKIEAGIKELNLGEIRVLDVDGNPAK
ncbi:MAG: pitrilysin family protein [Blastocatellia bacterium]